MEKIIGSFRKNCFEEIRLTIGKFMDADVIDLRTWSSKKNNIFARTLKGITLRVEQLPELKKLIEEVEAFLKKTENGETVT